jgi:NitT/TauT family transport system ATP-binding protein
MIHIQDVYKSYGPRSKPKLVLDNVDLSIAPGELVTLVGPSGCGKSTLLKLVLGQELPDSGKLLIEANPAGLADKRRGIVFQQYSLYPHLSVIDNVALGKRLSLPLWQRIAERKQIREEAMFQLRNLGLEEAIGKLPHELSGGMRQRVAVAQSLIMSPKIILMDEPFGALDPGSREHTQIFLLELWEKYKMTVIFVTHDLEEAVFLGTRLVILSQYYSDDRDDDCRRGSRVIQDIALSSRALSTEVKSSPEFNAMIDHVREIGFKPKHRLHVKDFNLSHPNSFRTLPE